MQKSFPRYTISLFFSLLLMALSLTAHAAPSRSVLVMGDSLSAAYGIPVEQGWVALLKDRLNSHTPVWTVVNASVSGETTGGGAGRLARALDDHQPAIVVLELGANDALRGLPLSQAQDNLQRMIDASHKTDARVLLIGIEIPPNYGPDYTEALQSMYRSLAVQNDIPFLPFLLAPVAGDLEAFQPDGLHPTAAAQPLILEHVWTALAPMLDAHQPEGAREVGAGN